MLVIGWRGNSKLKDEPQHLQQGKITKYFKFIRNNYIVYDDCKSEFIIKDLIKKAIQSSSPTALLFRKRYKSPKQNVNQIFLKITIKCRALMQ